MAGEWKSVQLGDVVDLLTGFPFKSQHYVDDPSAARLLRGDNVAQGTLRWDGARRWPGDRVDGLKEYELREGDVILAMDRPWIEAGLKYAAVRASDLPSFLVQRVARLRGTNQLDTKFLKYIIGSTEFTDYILSVQTGTAVPHISGGQIKSFEFRLPSPGEQRAIGYILGTMDEKVDLNRRTNETLQATATALFNSWFVDFDPVVAKRDGQLPVGVPVEAVDLFPSHFEESKIGPIPKGWQIVPLDSIADFLNGLALQRYPPHDSDDLPVIKIAELRAGTTVGADRCGGVPPEYVIDDGDVVFSWSGSLMVDVWCGGKGALNQHLFKVTSTKVPKWFYLAWLNEHLPEFQAIAADKATTMGHIRRFHLTEAEVLMPPNPLLTAMTRAQQPLLEKIIHNRVESRTLAALRDTLLGPLLSGELSIRSAERAVAAAL
jgi:type I restriction enzyme S subunit